MTECQYLQDLTDKKCYCVIEEEDNDLKFG